MFRLKWYDYMYTRYLKLWLRYRYTKRGRKLFKRVEKYSKLLREEEKKHDNTRNEA